MIPRYDCPEISQTWQSQYKFEQFLKVELAILEALEELEVIPPNTAKEISKHALIDTQRIHQLEKDLKHDVVAFCTSITEKLDPKVAKFFHYGVTSSDIIDTALSLQLKESLEKLLGQIKSLLISLRKKANDLKDVATIGRSHGMYAEPMSLGQKFLGFYSEFYRRFEDYQQFMEKELTAQFSGSIGNYAIIPPQAEKIAAKKLDLNVENLSTQIIPRDRLAKLVQIGSLMSCALERLSIEIRHLHRSEVAELYEGFSKGQKGSSTMPHKKNPISAENISGLSRFIRSQVSIAQENCLLWHERDISHSSAERLYLPDHFGILFYATKRMSETIENLIINKEIIEKRAYNHTTLSSFYLHHLIKTTDCSRESLYPLLQQASFESSHHSFHDRLEKLLKENNIKAQLPKIQEADIKKIYLKHTDEIFKRVLKR